MELSHLSRAAKPLDGRQALIPTSSAMALCCRCDGLSVKSFFQAHPESKEESSDFRPAALHACLLWNSGHELDQSRSQCALCALMWACLDQELVRLGDAECKLRLTDSAVTLEAKADAHKTTFPEPPAPGHHIVSLHVLATASTPSGAKQLRGKLRLLATQYPPCKSATSTQQNYARNR